MVPTLTCGVLKRVDDNGIPHLCNDPAYFRYKGLASVDPDKGQVIVDQCLSHSRSTFQRMEPALKDGLVTMRCLVQTKMTIRCHKCKSVFRFEPLAPTVVRAPGRFCPNCGTTAGDVSTTVDPELDYWEIISADLDLPTGLVKQIYSIWLADRTATNKFVQYVTEIQATLA